MRIALFFIGVLACQLSVAGPFTDQLSRCLVRSTSDADKVLLVKWVYAAISSHPQVQNMSKVSAAEGKELNRETAELMMQLLTVRCKKETIEAYKYDGASIFRTSFGVLGRVAMQGIMTNPGVAAYMSGLGKDLDSKKLKDMLKGAQR